MCPASRETSGASPASCNRDQTRRRLMRPCGSKVGAHFTASTSRIRFRVSSKTSNWAESSFLPPCRATSTEKLSPRRWSTLSRMARPASTW